MFSPTTLSERLLYSTVKIDSDAGSGTGFFFDFDLEQDKKLPLLFTNKHVIEGAASGEITIHLTDNDGIIIDSSSIKWQDNFNSPWILHPDANIDLCAMMINPYFDMLRRNGKNPYYLAFSQVNVPEQEQLEQLSALEDVVMVGYPRGLWDSVNKFPILRRGNTSSHPAVDFDGKSEGVIDIACFPGSSGSPIAVLNEESFNVKGQGLHVGSRIYFLGVLYAGPIMEADGRIVVKNIPLQGNPRFLTQIMIHLGFYVKARKVVELGEMIARREGLLP